MRKRYPGFLVGAVTLILALTVSVATAAQVWLPETPTPSIDPATVQMLIQFPEKTPGADLTPPLSGFNLSTMRFEDNPALNAGYLYNPPDPYCAVGLTHVVNVGNAYVEWRTKAGAGGPPELRAGLVGGFGTTPGFIGGGVGVFDPKVIYDQYSNRFIVVALQRTGDSLTLQARILIAVSKTSDPNAGWWFHSIDSMIPIDGVNRWADYPGLAVDDEALYITANMFNVEGTSYGGSRLWIVQKTPTYDGPDGSISQAVYDPYAEVNHPNWATTTQPTHMMGVPMAEPVNVGTFLVSYSGLTDGTNEYIDIIRVDNPTGVPVFSMQLLPVGNIDNMVGGGLPFVPQLGSTRMIRANDRRALQSVWRGNNLYMCAETWPEAAYDAANAGQVTAHWWRVDTTALGALLVADQGNVGGEDIGAATWTFFPAINVDLCGNMAVGFSASSNTMCASCYFASRLGGDPAGTIGGSVLLAAGLDYFVRTFSSSLTAPSRWGDYSGMSVDPVDNSTFYVYNEYAGTRGTPTTELGVTEDGRWWTALGWFSMCGPVSVAISEFRASARGDIVTLHGEFRSNLGVDAVNVYRGAIDGSMLRIDTAGMDGTTFDYTDRVAAGATYRYQIGVVDADGEFLSPIQTVSVRELGASLGQNNPNPFNPSTTISFTVVQKGDVTLNVYDANGRLVRTLVNGAREAGTHEITWDGHDNHNAPVGSGVYFYRLTAGKYSESKKMVLLK